MTFEAVQRIADAVLYEGYLLYPYRAGSSKDRVRFQFGVVMPRAFALGDGSETWTQQTELPIEPTTGADGRPMTPRVEVRVRALQLQARAVEVADVDAAGGFRPAARIVLDGEELVPWDEAVEAVIDLPPIAVAVDAPDGGEYPFTLAGAREVEHAHDSAGAITGRVVRTRWPIEGVDPLDDRAVGAIRPAADRGREPDTASPARRRRGTSPCGRRSWAATRCSPSATAPSSRSPIPATIPRHRTSCAAATTTTHGRCLRERKVGGTSS